jgi:purine-binding chemotaxis protein CheW
MINKRSASLDSFLICQTALRFCGFPLEHVVETMRILPVEPFPEMPSFVSGLSIIRGAAVPVINLAMLLGVATSLQTTRYVTVHLNQRLVAFAVESVIGVRSLDADSIKDLPPLLNNAEAGIVAAISTLDAELLLVLNGSRFIHESAMDSLFAQEIHS